MCLLRIAMLVAITQHHTAPCCTLLHPAAPCCTLLLTAAHCCTLLLTAAHCCSLLLTAAHCYCSPALVHTSGWPLVLRLHHRCCHQAYSLALLQFCWCRSIVPLDLQSATRRCVQAATRHTKLLHPPCLQPVHWPDARCLPAFNLSTGLTRVASPPSTHPRHAAADNAVASSGRTAAAD